MHELAHKTNFNKNHFRSNIVTSLCSDFFFFLGGGGGGGGGKQAKNN
jgi:hypothetical protein